jgi:DNA-binding PadR family transcriptional regulator
MTTLDLSHQRAVGDLLQAERSLRQKSEDTIRAMRQALVETANRFDGKRLEALRRDNPGIPANWSALDWKRFFDEVPVPSQGWGSVVSPDAQNERRVQKRIAELQAALTQAELDLERERATMVIVESQKLESESPAAGTTQNLLVADAIERIPPDATPALTVIIEDATRMRAAFPQKIPAPLSIALSGGERTGGDLARVFQRYWLIVYLIGRWRLAPSMEIEEALAGAVNVSPGSGSLRRVLDDMEEANVITAGIIKLKSPRTTLKLYRLSAVGENLYQDIFQTQPTENEWSRLIRLHEGERFPEHTMAVIAFAMHARKRGWATQVLPELTGTKSVPDALILRGNEKWYVEVELGDKERVSKWRNQAALNGGRVALCAATQKTRTRLAGDCRLDKLAGMATDLETLIRNKFKELNSSSPFWLEEWD